MSSRRDEQAPVSVRVPADVERPDEVVFGLTARQLGIAATVALTLWGLYQATTAVIPPLLFAALAMPVAGATLALLVVRRDGLGLDEWLVAALRQHRAPRRLVPAETAEPGRGLPDAPRWVAAAAGSLPAPLALPATAISDTGQVDLGDEGVAELAACSTVNFGLRTPAEQHSLIAGFARWLHSLTGPAQIVISADRLDLGDYLDTLRTSAPGLPHPELEAACLAHADHLQRLAAETDLLHRHVTVVLREPPGKGGRDTASATVARRAADNGRALGACEITARTLDGAGAHAVISAAADPHGRHPGPTRAASGPVTATGELVAALSDPADDTTPGSRT